MRFADGIPDPDFVSIDQFPEPFIRLDKMHRSSGIYANSPRLGMDFSHFKNVMSQSSTHITDYSWDVVTTFKLPAPTSLGAVGMLGIICFRLKRNGVITRFGRLLKLQYAIVSQLSVCSLIIGEYLCELWT